MEKVVRFFSGGSQQADTERGSAFLRNPSQQPSSSTSELPRRDNIVYDKPQKENKYILIGTSKLQPLTRENTKAVSCLYSKKQFSPLNARQISDRGDKIAALPEKKCFQKLTEQDRLAIVDLNYEDNNSARSTPKYLARVLKYHGLEKIGVLTLHFNNGGYGEFLEDLSKELGNQGITAGYLKGYQGVPRIFSSEYQTEAPQTALYKRVQSRTIKGNINIEFSGTKYKIPASEELSSYIAPHFEE